MNLLPQDPSQWAFLAAALAIAATVAVWIVRDARRQRRRSLLIEERLSRPPHWARSDYLLALRLAAARGEVPAAVELFGVHLAQFAETLGRAGAAGASTAVTMRRLSDALLAGD